MVAVFADFSPVSWGFGSARLVETLHAANGPPGRKGVTGEFVYHASPGTSECTLRLNPADTAIACQLIKKHKLLKGGRHEKSRVLQVWNVIICFNGDVTAAVNRKFHEQPVLGGNG